MNDDDLIRRGDALAACDASGCRMGSVVAGGSVAQVRDRIAALPAAREAQAREEGVRAGLMAAAFEASLHAAEMEHDQRHGGAMDVIDTIRAIAADPAYVAEIAASAKGGE